MISTYFVLIEMYYCNIAASKFWTERTSNDWHAFQILSGIILVLISPKFEEMLGLSRIFGIGLSLQI